jgi:hypothetical protein
MTDTMEKLSNMPRRAVLAAGAAVAGGGLALVGPQEAVEASERRRPFGGAYYVLADAPYGPHLMTFNADGTMTSTNPTNVQDGPAASVKVTDSVGMGSWRYDGREHVLITMVQENANQPARDRSLRLHVSARVKISRDGDFEGPAIAELLAMDGDSKRTDSVVEANRSYLQGSKLRERFAHLAPADRKYLGLR